ncbi:hypothetical protein [Sulfurimonas indica]|uniref:hypothetical protein n=1 Tax=Sulfurimonas TaxID=202746 RepID=UPI00126561B1|nr:hypothetical protein [Sulfurimonas indica]
MTTFNIKMDFHGSYDAAITMLTITKEQYELIKKAQKDVSNSKIIDEAILGSNVMSHEDLREYDGKKDISDITLSNLQAFEFKLEEMEVKLYKNELHAYFKYSDDDDTLYAAKSISIKELDNFFNPENSELVEKDSNTYYCEICCMETTFDEQDNCEVCGNHRGSEMSEKDEENQNLAFENKMMAEALSTLGFSQEEISNICAGSLKIQKPLLRVMQLNKDECISDDVFHELVEESGASLHREGTADEYAIIKVLANEVI